MNNVKNKKTTKMSLLQNMDYRPKNQSSSGSQTSPAHRKKLQQEYMVRLQGEQAEIFAILTCASENLRWMYKKYLLHVFLGSKAALKALYNPKKKNVKISDKMLRETQRTNVGIPAHSVI